MVCTESQSGQVLLYFVICEEVLEAVYCVHLSQHVNCIVMYKADQKK